jgi:hypothetical protein
LPKTKLKTDLQSLLVTPVKITAASLITGLFLWVPMRLLDQFIFDTTRTVNLILLTLTAAVIGALVYLGLSKLLGLKEMDAYLHLIKKLGNWKKVLSSSEETIDQASPTI